MRRATVGGPQCKVSPTLVKASSQQERIVTVCYIALPSCVHEVVTSTIQGFIQDF